MLEKGIHRTVPCERPLRAVYVPDWLRDYARELHKYQNVVSVVLFGSRVSGRYFDDSDWDLAVLYKDGFDKSLCIPPPDDVEVVWIAYERFLVDYCCIATISREVHDNHLLLEGQLLPPMAKKLIPASRQQIVLFVRNVYEGLFNGLVHLEADWRNNDRPVEDFQTQESRDTAKAAEYAAKVLCTLRTDSLLRTHDAVKLAELVTPDLKEVVLGLNGGTKRSFSGPYEPMETEPFTHALKRVQNILRLLDAMHTSQFELNLSKSESQSIARWLELDLPRGLAQIEHPELQRLVDELTEHVRRHLGDVC